MHFTMCFTLCSEHVLGKVTLCFILCFTLCSKHGISTEKLLCAYSAFYFTRKYFAQANYIILLVNYDWQTMAGNILLGLFFPALQLLAFILSKFVAIEVKKIML